MALVLKRLYEGYFKLSENADPRTDHMIIVGSPIQLAAALFSYVYCVKVLGPHLMKDRKPFEIRKVIIVYNILQLILNIYCFIWGLILIKDIDWLCGPIDYGHGGQPILRLGYLYMIIKLFDWLDTVFFVMKKSYRQVTFLHVYHHACMLICIWMGLSYYGGGSSLWIPVLNSFVHIVMFVYYLLTSIDSSWKQSYYFKRTLTQIQLIQFVIFIVIYGKILFLPNCTYPRLPCYLLVPQNMFMLCLFGDFYLKTYVFQKRPDKVKSR